LTNRKNQNSILFLTTLGVYLGLVLVGATPQVLAQAATARHFDISEEMGHVENLDTDPSKQSDRNSVAIKIRRSVSAFLAEFASVRACGASADTPKPLHRVSTIRHADTVSRPPVEYSLGRILSPHHLARASI
jgi:hypothetical protein